MASVSIVGSMGIVPQPTVMKVAEISRGAKVELANVVADHVVAMNDRDIVKAGHAQEVLKRAVTSTPVIRVLRKVTIKSEPRLLSPPLTMSETGYHPPALWRILVPQGT
jgi:hypothetical protein